MIICFEFLSFDVFEECKKDEEEYASMLKWCHGWWIEGLKRASREKIDAIML